MIEYLLTYNDLKSDINFTFLPTDIVAHMLYEPTINENTMLMTYRYFMNEMIINDDPYEFLVNEIYETDNNGENPYPIL